MLALVAALALAVQLDRSADAALPCPAHAALAEALQRRAAAAGPVQASFTWRDGSWRLILRRAGTVLLERSWSLPPSDCALLADTAALVIDRYFSGLRQPRWTPRPQRVAALAPVAVAPLPAPPPSAAPPPLPPPSFDEPARPVLIPSMPAIADGGEPPASASGLVLSMGLALLDDGRAGFWMQAERRWSSGTASFVLLAGASDMESERGGETQLRSALMALSVGPCFDVWLRACFAPFAGVRGQLRPVRRTLHADTDLKLVPELGAMASLEYPLPYRLKAGFSLLLGKTLGEADFDPDSPPQEADYAVALRVGYQF